MNEYNEDNDYFHGDEVDELSDTIMTYKPVPGNKSLHGGLGNLGGLGGMLKKQEQGLGKGLGGLQKPASKGLGGLGGLGGINRKVPQKPTGGLGGLTGLGGIGPKKPSPKPVEDKNVEFQNKILKGLEMTFAKNYEYQNKLLEKMENLSVSAPQDDEGRMGMLKNILAEKIRSYEAFIYLPNLGPEDEGPTISLERLNELYQDSDLNVVRDLGELLEN